MIWCRADPTRLLLTFNAKVNMTDDLMQNTALHLAAGSGNNVAAKLLLEAGADVEAKNQKVSACYKFILDDVKPVFRTREIFCFRFLTLVII